MGNGVSAINSPLNSFRDTLNDLLSNAHLQILLIGIESSGKSTLLQRLKHDHYVEMTPTIGFDSFKMKYRMKNNKLVNLHLWDLGGQDRVRPLWKSFIKCADAICFVVDTSDISKLDEAKMEFNTAYRYFHDCKRKLNSINYKKQNFNTSNRLPTFSKVDDLCLPFIILANKCDLPNNHFVMEKGLYLLNDYFYNETSFKILKEYLDAHTSLNYKKTYESTTSNHLSDMQDNLDNKRLNSKSTPQKKHLFLFSSTAFNISPKDTRKRMIDDQCLNTSKNSSKDFSRQFSSTSNLNIIHKTLVAPTDTISPLTKTQNNLQNSLIDARNHKLRVYPVCGITGEGIDEAFESLFLLLENYRSKKAKIT